MLAVALCGCQTFEGTAPERAVAELQPTQGHKAHGTVIFTKVRNGIKVEADVLDLSPGEHGFHLHEKGDCSAADASSAGGHFDPAGMRVHGGLQSVRRHAGDFGNVIADYSGHAHLKFVDPILTFDGPSSIIGRAVVVHAQPDDLVTQPTGNSGPRVACGVIVREQQQPPEPAKTEPAKTEPAK